jgi:hypothetical protein
MFERIVFHFFLVLLCLPVTQYLVPIQPVWMDCFSALLFSGNFFFYNPYKKWFIEGLKYPNS